MAKGRKYEGLAQRVPKLANVADNPEYQQRVEAVKETIIGPCTRETGEDYPAQWVHELFLKRVGEAQAATADLTRLTGGEATPHALATAWIRLREAQDAVESLRSEINLLLEAHLQLMVDGMEGAGVDKVGVLGKTVSVYLEPYTTVTDRDAIREWVMADPDLRNSLALPWSTLNSLCKRLLDAGEELPPGTKVWAKSKARMG